ncbi:serine acetyltransferase [Micromonospora sp. NPDC050417]|uniref:serine acetyltransferase n=1 Tax=Micromonospora sp. NPDC050417 TaxID=3364280 RepID=UPI0037A1E0FC
MFDTLRQDYRRNRDPLVRLVLTVFRFGQWTVARRTPIRRLCTLPYKVLNLVVIRLGTNSDLPRELSCGPGLRLFHPYGLVFHRDARLGRDVSVYHQVTIGRRDHSGEPQIGDGVTLGAGATVLGPVVVGRGAKIGAGATVLDDVPPGGRAIGPRAQVTGVRQGERRADSDHGTPLLAGG